MFKHFIRNINLFPEGDSCSKLWTQTMFGLMFLLQGQESKEWRDSSTVPVCPASLPTAEGLRYGHALYQTAPTLWLGGKCGACSCPSPSVPGAEK